MKPVVHQFEDKLLDFAYGELQPHEAEAVDAHVRGCTRCAQSLSSITSVRATMQLLPMEPAPTAGLDSLLAYAEQHARRNAKPQPAWWRRLIVPLSSVMALLTVGVVAMRASYTPDTVAAAFPSQQEQVRAAPVNKAAPAQAPIAAAPEPVIAQAIAPTPPAVIANDFKPSETLALKDAEKLERKEESISDGLLKEQAGPKGKAAGVKTGALRSDYSNSGASLDRGTRAPHAELAALDAPAKNADLSENKKNAKKDDVGSFGLQANSIGTAGSGRGSGDVKTEKDKAPSKPPTSPGSGGDFDSTYGGRAEVATASAAQEPSPTTPPHAAPSTQAPSLPLGGVRKERVQTAQPNKVAASEGREGAVSDDEQQAVRSRVTNVFEAQLAGARAASNRGDRQSEINECLLVLNGGAQGYQRAESLKRLCDAYDALGQPDRAQAFCDALLNEFGQTAAAKQMVQRRSAGLRDAKAAPKKLQAPVDELERQQDKASSKPVKR